MGAIDTSILWTDKLRNLAKSSRIRNVLSLSLSPFPFFARFLVSFRFVIRSHTNPTIAVQSTTALRGPIRGTYFCNFVYFRVFKFRKFSLDNDRVIHLSYHLQIIIWHEHPADMHNYARASTQVHIAHIRCRSTRALGRKQRAPLAINSV